MNETKTGYRRFPLEVHFPLSAFKEAAIPRPNVAWHVSFTRHRVADQGLKPRFTTHSDSKREYQRMNTTLAKPSHNLSDFVPLKFAE